MTHFLFSVLQKRFNGFDPKGFLKHICKVILVGASIISLSACSINYVLDYIEDEGMKSGSWVEVKEGKETIIKASIDGAIIMNDAETDIIEFPPNSEFTISIAENETIFMQVVRKGTAPVEVNYELNGKKVARDALSAEQHQLLWLTFFRRTGHSSNERLARIVKNGGIDALFTEIEAIKSSSVKRRYIEGLTRNYALDDAQVLATISLINDMESDSESRRSFSALLAGKTPLSEAQVIALLSATNNISSNTALGGLLSDILERTPAPMLTPALSNALLETSENLTSNSKLNRFFESMLERTDEQQTLAKIITLAGKNISSNNRLSSLYNNIAEKELGRENTLLLLKSAADNISSSGRLADLVINIIESKNFDLSLIDEIKKLADNVSSTSRRDDILEALNIFAR